MTDESPRAIRLDALAYGGDYNPDQWSEEVWHQDIRLMREAGVNIVSLPVFSWPQLETAPGVYEWDWLDRIIDLLWAGGIAVDLATATATPPSWLIRSHPEMLPWNEAGQRLEFGSRQAYCPSSPVWRENVARMTRAMADRYGDHPALALWHVSNEYGDHVSRCWCPESSAHFRRWLEARYGDLDGLNEAWGVNVWGQRYTDWAHIEAPRRSTGPVNPTQLLDFERFSSDALLELFQLEVDILREITPEIGVTTNFMSILRDLDYWKFAAAEDLVTDDAYPDPADPLAHVPAALNYGYMRSLKGGQPWLLLEQAPSGVSWRDVNVPKAPGHYRIGSLQAIAHGSDGAMVFQWRQAKYGQEKFHSAMVGHRGEASRSFQEAKAFGAELKQLEPVRGSRVRSRIALVVDHDSWWGSSATESLPSQRLQWLAQTRAWHAALHALGHAVDTVRATGPLDGYDVVVVPNLYVADAAQAQVFSDFVARGGQLVVGPFSGVVDDTEKVHDGGAPGPLRGLLGIEVDEQWPVADGLAERVAFSAGGEFDVPTWGEWLEVHDGTEVLARYASGELDGRAAITRRAVGGLDTALRAYSTDRPGAAWYVSCVLEHDGLVALFRDALAAAGLPARERIDLDLEAVTRSDETTDYTFVLNHGRREITVDVPTGANDLLGGEGLETLRSSTTGGRTTLTLPRFGAAVLATPRAAEPPFITLSHAHDTND
ncbi:beta-galactosidase [Agromyces endophyticus]|uniref:beta-galactosidase n=1 Tax=Agromyces sp. H17E-10 TaxID=2932244 RepID=UPI001FD269BD|nr:beta-galactosidase [Agromyces sp. H17E-10]UOQ89985.1 beta-galactosidase [Agromyces sp. H17E-10]